MQNDIQDKLSSIPGVTSAAFGSAMPMEGYGVEPGRRELGRRPHRRPAGLRRRTLRRCGCSNTPHPVSSKLRAPELVAGREITWTEVYGLTPVVLISESLARELWGTPAAAIGKRLRQAPGMPVA